MNTMNTAAASTMTHKEMTAHIRGRIKHAGINARVKMYVSCGSREICVFSPAYGVMFTDEEQRTIRTIAQVNRLTWVRGMAINIEQMTNPYDFRFHMPV